MSDNNDFKATVMPKEHGASEQSSQGLPGIQLPTGEQLKAFASDIQKMDAKELNEKMNEFKSTVMPKEHGASHQSSQGLPGIQLPTGDQLKAFQTEIQKMDAKELNEKMNEAKEYLTKKKD